MKQWGRWNYQQLFLSRALMESCFALWQSYQFQSKASNSGWKMLLFFSVDISVKCDGLGAPVGVVYLYRQCGSSFVPLRPPPILPHPGELISSSMFCNMGGILKV